MADDLKPIDPDDAPDGFMAVESRIVRGCQGCVNESFRRGSLANPETGFPCASEDFSCCNFTRADGRDVIFIRRPAKPTDAELEAQTGEPHIDGYPLMSGLPPPASAEADASMVYPPMPVPIAWADDRAASGDVGNTASDSAKRYWTRPNANWVDRATGEALKHPLFSAQQMSEYAAKCVVEATTEQAASLRAEVEQLTKHLKQANNQAEHFERLWYLAKEDAERYAFAKTLEGQVVTMETFKVYGAAALDQALDDRMAEEEDAKPAQGGEG